MRVQVVASVLAVAALVSAQLPPPPSQPDLATLQLLPNTTDGLCLDGTPAGFYYRISQKGPQRKWIIWFEGGAYCYSDQNCHDTRFGTDLGSSANYPQTANFSGMLSGDPIANPNFYDYNMIALKYCDGGFWGGNKASPVNYTAANTLIYYRGKQILQRTFELLYSKFSFANATEVIVTGCSAGGVAVFLHIDWIRSMIPTNVRVVGVPDSGFFLDIPNWHGVNIYTQYNIYWGGYLTHNLTFTNDACIADVASLGQPAYYCALTQYMAKYVQTPLFVINSVVDSFQMHNMVSLSTQCFDYDGGQHALNNCSSLELSAIANFTTKIKADLKSMVLNKWQNGAFLPACLTHCGAADPPATPSYWQTAQITVNSTMGANSNPGYVTLTNAFSDWYFGGAWKNDIVINMGPGWPSDNCKNVFTAFSAPNNTVMPTSTPAPTQSNANNDDNKKKTIAAGVGAGVGCFAGIIGAAALVLWFKRAPNRQGGAPPTNRGDTAAVRLD